MLAPGLQLRRGARRHQRHRHRAGGGRPGPRLRARALRRAPGAVRLRRRADPRPGLGQDGRRDRPDLLAQGRRPADDLPGQGHRRPDHPGPGDGQQQPGHRPAPGVRAGLPPDRRHRDGARQRRRHAERPRPQRARPGRPGRADRPRHRGAGQPSHRRGHRRPAQRRGGPGVLPPRSATALRRRRGARQADRPARWAWPTCPPRGPAMYLPGLVGSGVLWLRACREAEALYESSRLADPGGRERRRQAGPGPGRTPAPEPGRAVPRARRRMRPIRTGWPRPAASCSTARACWSSGTSTR